MKVMVNGATGLVGMAIMDAFLEAGHDVRASDHPRCDFREVESKGVEVVPADLDDADALDKSVEGMDVVVHVAGIFDLGASPKLLERVNHQGTRDVLEAVLRKAPNLHRFVQIATVGVYGEPVRCPCKEDDPKRPRNAYEKSKFKGELAAFEYHKKHGLPVTSIRPTLVYGPRAKYGHAMFIAGLCLLKHKTERDWMVGLTSGPKTSHVHVDDVGRAAVLVAEKDGAIGKPHNIADPNPVDGLTFSKALAEPIGFELRPYVPYVKPLMSLVGAALPYVPQRPIDWFNGYVAKWWDELCDEKGLSKELNLKADKDWIGYCTGDNFYDVSRIKELGMQWKYPDCVEGLKETIQWYRDREWIP